MKIRTRAGFEFSKDGIKEGTSCNYCGATHTLTTVHDEQVCECNFCGIKLHRIGVELADSRDRYTFHDDIVFIEHL